MLETAIIKIAVNKLKSFAHHIHRSQVGAAAFREIQAMKKLPQTLPEKGSNTRWGAGYEQVVWFLEQKDAVQIYWMAHPGNCVANEDGTHFYEKTMDAGDWDIIRFVEATLAHASVFNKVIQGTQTLNPKP